MLDASWIQILMGSVYRKLLLVYDVFKSIKHLFILGLVENTYYVGFDENLPTETKNRELSYYQYVRLHFLNIKCSFTLGNLDFRVYDVAFRYR